MISIFIFLAAPVLWQEDFNEDASTLHQLYDYRIEITYHDGQVRLTANPPFEGFASAWLYLEKEIYFKDDDVLEIRIRVNANAARIRYFFRKESCRGYHTGENIIFGGDQWQDIEIPLKHAQSFSGSDFPAALTPGKTPSLYLFIENVVAGDFDIDLDRIAVTKPGTIKEPK